MGLFGSKAKKAFGGRRPTAEEMAEYFANVDEYSDVLDAVDLWAPLTPEEWRGLVRLPDLGPVPFVVFFNQLRDREFGGSELIAIYESLARDRKLGVETRGKLRPWARGLFENAIKTKSANDAMVQWYAKLVVELCETADDLIPWAMFCESVGLLALGHRMANSDVWQAYCTKARTVEDLRAAIALATGHQWPIDGRVLQANRDIIPDLWPRLDEATRWVAWGMILGAWEDVVLKREFAIVFEQASVEMIKTISSDRWASGMSRGVSDVKGALFRRLNDVRRGGGEVQTGPVTLP